MNVSGFFLSLVRYLACCTARGWSGSQCALGLAVDAIAVSATALGIIWLSAKAGDNDRNMYRTRKWMPLKWDWPSIAAFVKSLSVSRILTWHS